MRDENFIIEVDGEMINCEMFLTFENNNNKFIVYTDHVLDHEGEERLLASKYIIENGKVVLLGELTNEEYDLVDKEMEKLING